MFYGLITDYISIQNVSRMLFILPSGNKMISKFIIFQVWTDKTIDSYAVSATYIDPQDSDDKGPDAVLDFKWNMAHVRQSQYLLQIVR